MEQERDRENNKPSKDPIYFNDRLNIKYYFFSSTGWKVHKLDEFSSNISSFSLKTEEKQKSRAYFILTVVYDIEKSRE